MDNPSPQPNQESNHNLFNINSFFFKDILSLVCHALKEFKINFKSGFYIPCKGLMTNVLLNFTEGGGFLSAKFVPAKCFGNAGYYRHVREPKIQKLFQWLNSALKATPYSSNFLHIVLQTGSNPQARSEVKECFPLLKGAYNHFITSLKHSFPIVNYAAAVEVSLNMLTHIHLIIELQSPLPMYPAKNDTARGDNLVPLSDTIDGITALWNKALKKECGMRGCEYRPIKVFTSGIYDSKIINYFTKQWNPIDNLIKKDSALLSDLEKCTVAVHYFCKCFGFQQIYNSKAVDAIPLPDLYIESFEKNSALNGITVKMYLNPRNTALGALSLEDMPFYSERISPENHPKFNEMIQNLVKKYRKAFDLIIANSLKDGRLLNLIYTFEDLLNILYYEDSYFEDRKNIFNAEGGE
jgi:hypothetical protein